MWLIAYSATSGALGQQSADSGGSAPSSAAVHVKLSPSKTGQSHVPFSRGLPSRMPAARSHWAPQGGPQGVSDAQMPHMGASSTAAHQQRSAGQHQVFPEKPAHAVSRDPQQAQHAGSACGSRDAQDAQMPHMAASSASMHHQRSAGLQWSFPAWPAQAALGGAQQAQHPSAACSSRSAVLEAYQAALGGPKAECPGKVPLLRAQSEGRLYC